MSAPTEVMAWDDPTQYVNPLSLLDSKRHHQWVLRAMFDASQEFKKANKAEVLAKLEFEAAERRAVLRNDCPKVRRDGVSAAERDAWVGDVVADEKRAYELAKAAALASKNQVETLRALGYSMGQLGQIVKQIHDTAGVDR